ncbi:hypothetical protein ACO2Q7_11060 [Rathayibacter sp. KR2-224]|uniref:hypothetical protein n=1 Tax=Rathayibacter sp. KR2-224 TaxID=3400913 RepID=UPI003C0CEFE6
MHHAPRTTPHAPRQAPGRHQHGVADSGADTVVGMDWLVLVAIVVLVLGGISLLAYLRRIATAVERVANALEVQGAGAERNEHAGEA